MTCITPLISSQIAIATLVAGCAITPTAKTTPAHSADAGCRQLSAEIANAEKARHAALEKEKGALEGRDSRRGGGPLCQRQIGCRESRKTTRQAPRRVHPARL